MTCFVLAVFPCGSKLGYQNTILEEVCSEVDGDISLADEIDAVRIELLALDNKRTSTSNRSRDRSAARQQLVTTTKKLGYFVKQALSQAQQGNVVTVVSSSVTYGPWKCGFTEEVARKLLGYIKEYDDRLLHRGDKGEQLGLTRCLQPALASISE